MRKIRLSVQGIPPTSWHVHIVGVVVVIFLVSLRCKNARAIFFHQLNLQKRKDFSLTTIVTGVFFYGVEKRVSQIVYCFFGMMKIWKSKAKLSSSIERARNSIKGILRTGRFDYKGHRVSGLVRYSRLDWKKISKKIYSFLCTYTGTKDEEWNEEDVPV